MKVKLVKALRVVTRCSKTLVSFSCYREWLLSRQERSELGSYNKSWCIRASNDDL